MSITLLACAAGAAAAKLLQSCPTLCNPIDSPSGSPVAGILQVRTLEQAAISFSNAGKESESELTQLCPTLCDPMDYSSQASLSITNSLSLLTFISIRSIMPSNHLILCHPLPFPPSIFPSIRVFSNESVLHIRWPKYWFQTSAPVLPMNIQD